MKIINPASEQILTEIEADSPRLIHNAYHSAVEAQSLWAARSLKDRIKHLRNFNQLLEENKEDLAKTLTNEVGKPYWQSINEINGARGRIAYFLENSERWLQEETVQQSEGLTEKISYEPLGVIGNISAWNYPYLVGVNVFIPALIAGNAVLYKASEYAALTGLKIEALMHEAGVPQHVFQTITGGAETGETLLTLPLDGYYFTGSHKTGQYIYE
ncbi:MAG: aldehyde dehydrogenase family protein, partial [Bacteroidota bacterium]